MEARALLSRHLHIALVLAMTLMLVGTPAASAEDPQPDVSGGVFDVNTGEPIAGANVGLFHIWPPPSPFAFTVTDASGYYEFPTVHNPVGEARADFVHVWVDDDSYESRGMPPEDEFPLFDGEPVVQDVELWPKVGDPRVRGTVTIGDTGEPLDTEWAALAIIYEDEGFWNNAAGIVSEGEFAFWRVYPHRPFRLEFMMEGYEPFPFLSDVLIWNDGIGPDSRDGCMRGGWEDFGFRNQGQCIRFLNTGTDSRGPTQVVVDIVIWEE